MAYTTIDNPGLFFNTVLYTGNGTAIGSGGQAIQGVGFAPDWTWIKERSSTSPHKLLDTVRGATKELESSATSAEATTAESLASFDSDGFTVGSNGAVNENSQTYASWNWLAGGTASSNSNGSITSSVSANTTSGFSIVSYTGNQTNSTVGHGLGVAPKLIIFKNRVRSDGDWIVGSTVLSSNWSNFLYLSGTNAVTNLSLFQDTAPTSSFFYLGTNNNINQTGSGIIAYCFAEKKGYSKFGSYTGNGNADGAFVYTGFRPAWIMVKRTGGVTNWQIQDSKRDGFNDQNKRILANVNEAEKTSQMWDQLSNGFKIRVTSENANGSGMSYIYMAFAEAPFVTAGTKAAGTAR